MKKHSMIAAAAALTLALGSSAAQAGSHGSYSHGSHHHGGNDGLAIALGVTGALFGVAAIADAVSQPYYYSAPPVAYRTYYGPHPVYYGPPPVYYRGYYRGYYGPRY